MEKVEQGERGEREAASNNLGVVAPLWARASDSESAAFEFMLACVGSRCVGGHTTREAEASAALPFCARAQRDSR